MTVHDSDTRNWSSTAHLLNGDFLKIIQRSWKISCQELYQSVLANWQGRQDGKSLNNQEHMNVRMFGESENVITVESKHI